MPRGGRRIFSNGEDSRHPKKPVSSDGRFWHVGRALEAARAANEAARTASAGLVHTGVGIAGIGLIVSTTTGMARGPCLARTEGLAALFFLVSLGFGIIGMVFRRKALFALVEADDAGFKEQLVRHGFTVDPQDAKSPEYYRKKRKAALAKAKRLGKEWSLWVQFIVLLGAFILLGGRQIFSFWPALRQAICG